MSNKIEILVWVTLESHLLSNLENQHLQLVLIKGIVNEPIWRL